MKIRVKMALALLVCIGVVTAVAQERLRECQSRCQKYRHGQEQQLCKFRCQKTLPESEVENHQSDPGKQLRDCRQRCQIELKEDKKEMMKCERDCSEKFGRQQGGAGTINPEEEEQEMQQKVNELFFPVPGKQMKSNWSIF